MNKFIVFGYEKGKSGITSFVKTDRLLVFFFIYDLLTI